MTNDMYAGILIGACFVITIVAVLQIGINIGIKSCQAIIEHEYPAAYKFIFKHKNIIRVMPHVIGSKND